MAGLFLDSGVLYMANGIYDKLNADQLYLRLFKTNHTPGLSDVDADYTGAGKEADFPGYAAILLDTWTVGSVASHIAAITEILRVFVSTGTSSNMIYGYFLSTTPSSSGTVIAAERDPGAPVDMTASSAVYAVVPKIRDKNP